MSERLTRHARGTDQLVVGRTFAGAVDVLDLPLAAGVQIAGQATLPVADAVLVELARYPAVSCLCRLIWASLLIS